MNGVLITPLLRPRYSAIISLVKSTVFCWPTVIHELLQDAWSVSVVTDLLPVQPPGTPAAELGMHPGRIRSAAAPPPVVQQNSKVENMDINIACSRTTSHWAYMTNLDIIIARSGTMSHWADMTNLENGMCSVRRCASDSN
jgi:hypothetical protein